MTERGYTLVPRRIIATMVVLFFGDLALRADHYITPSYQVAAEFMPLTWWGTLIAACGIVMLATHGRWPVYVATAAMAAWCGALVSAVLQGLSPSPMGSVWLIGVVVLLVWSTGQDGFTK